VDFVQYPAWSVSPPAAPAMGLVCSQNYQPGRRTVGTEAFLRNARSVAATPNEGRRTSTSEASQVPPPKSPKASQPKPEPAGMSATTLVLVLIAVALIVFGSTLAIREGMVQVPQSLKALFSSQTQKEDQTEEKPVVEENKTRATPGCAAQGIDPFSGGHGVCCEGLVEKLGDWSHKGGSWTYLCVGPNEEAPKPLAPPPAEEQAADAHAAPKVLFAPPALPHAPPPPTGPAARFLNFNIFNANHNYASLAGVISKIAPDIAVLEEIPDPGAQQRLIGALHAHGMPYQFAPPGPGTHGHQVYDGHIMFRTDKWHVLQSNTLLIDQRARIPGLMRGVHWAVMERNADHKRVLVFGAHPSYDPMPTKQPKDWPAMDLFQKAAPMMKGLSDHWGIPAVVMCDCNTGVAAKSVQWLQAGNGGLKFNMASTAQIDHIFTEAAPHPVGRASNAFVINRGGLVGVRRPEWGMADHPPVFVDVVLSR